MPDTVMPLLTPRQKKIILSYFRENIQKSLYKRSWEVDPIKCFIDDLGKLGMDLSDRNIRLGIAQLIKADVEWIVHRKDRLKAKISELENLLKNDKENQVGFFQKLVIRWMIFRNKENSSELDVFLKPKDNQLGFFQKIGVRWRVFRNKRNLSSKNKKLKYRLLSQNAFSLPPLIVNKNEKDEPLKTSKGIFSKLRLFFLRWWGFDQFKGVVVSENFFNDLKKKIEENILEVTHKVEVPFRVNQERAEESAHKKEGGNQSLSSISTCFKKDDLKLTAKGYINRLNWNVSIPDFVLTRAEGLYQKKDGTEAKVILEVSSELDQEEEQNQEQEQEQSQDNIQVLFSKANHSEFEIIRDNHNIQECASSPRDYIKNHSLITSLKKSAKTIEDIKKIPILSDALTKFFRFNHGGLAKEMKIELEAGRKLEEYRGTIVGDGRYRTMPFPMGFFLRKDDRRCEVLCYSEEMYAFHKKNNPGKLDLKMDCDDVVREVAYGLSRVFSNYKKYDKSNLYFDIKKAVMEGSKESLSNCTYNGRSCHERLGSAFENFLFYLNQSNLNKEEIDHLMGCFRKMSKMEIPIFYRIHSQQTNLLTMFLLFFFKRTSDSSVFNNPEFSRLVDRVSNFSEFEINTFHLVFYNFVSWGDDFNFISSIKPLIEMLDVLKEMVGESFLSKNCFHMNSLGQVKSFLEFYYALRNRGLTLEEIKLFVSPACAPDDHDFILMHDYKKLELLIEKGYGFFSGEMLTISDCWAWSRGDKRNKGDEDGEDGCIKKAYDKYKKAIALVLEINDDKFNFYDVDSIALGKILNSKDVIPVYQKAAFLRHCALYTTLNSEESFQLWDNWDNRVKLFSKEAPDAGRLTGDDYHLKLSMMSSPEQREQAARDAQRSRADLTKEVIKTLESKKRPPETSAKGQYYVERGYQDLFESFSVASKRKPKQAKNQLGQGFENYANQYIARLGINDSNIVDDLKDFSKAMGSKDYSKVTPEEVSEQLTRSFKDLEVDKIKETAIDYLCLLREVHFKMTEQWLRYEQMLEIYYLFQYPSIAQIKTSEGKTNILSMLALLKAKLSVCKGADEADDLKLPEVHMVFHDDHLTREALNNVKGLAKHAGVELFLNKSQSSVPSEGDENKPSIVFFEVSKWVQSGFVQSESSTTIDSVIFDEVDHVLVTYPATTSVVTSKKYEETTASLQGRYHDFLKALIDLNQSDQGISISTIAERLEINPSDVKEGLFFGLPLEIWKNSVLAAQNKKENIHFVIEKSIQALAQDQYDVFIIEKDTTGRVNKKTRWSEGVHDLVAMNLSLLEDKKPENEKRKIHVSDLPMLVDEEIGLKTAFEAFKPKNMSGVSGTICEKFFGDIYDDYSKLCSHQEDIRKVCFSRAVKFGKDNKPMATTLTFAEDINEGNNRFKFDREALRQKRAERRQGKKSGEEAESTDVYQVNTYQDILNRFDFPLRVHDDLTSYYQDLAKQVSQAQESVQSMLLFFNSIEEVSLFYKVLYANKGWINLNNVQLYHDKNDAEQGDKLSDNIIIQKASEPGMITLTTAVGSRGQDFKNVQYGLICSPGLSTVEEQQLSRMARNGQISSTSRVFYRDPSTIDSSSDDSKNHLQYFETQQAKKTAGYGKTVANKFAHKK